MGFEVVKHLDKDFHIACISWSDYDRFGCPSCGCDSAAGGGVSGGGAQLAVCRECGSNYVILADGLEKSSMGFNKDGGTVFSMRGELEESDDIVIPVRQKHPRHGTPKHAYIRPDVRPDGGGDFFNSRGIGIDTTPGCFCCGGEKKYYNNIAAFVESKQAGERIVEFFGGFGAWLDYREYEPDWIQVKIGACDEHLPNLKKLAELTEDDVITFDKVEVIKRMIDER